MTEFLQKNLQNWLRKVSGKMNGKKSFENRYFADVYLSITM